MLCPYCNFEDSKVIESRATAEKSSIRRRRECEKCQARFTTYEKVEISPFIVVKKNGNREEYSREKLLASILNAVKNSDSDINVYEEITDNIEQELFKATRREITSSNIGEKAIEFLKPVNKLAYIRYKSIFKEYKTIDQLARELQEL